MNKTEPKIGVVIVHFRSVSDTQELLEGLIKQKYKNKLIYIVDNDAKNRFPKKNINKPFIKLFVSKENLGFPSGANLGAKKCIENGCDIITFLTYDLIIKDPDILSKLVDGLEEKAVGATIPIVVYNQTPDKVWLAGGKLYDWLGYTRHLGYNYSVNDFKKWESYPDFGGIGLTVTKEVLKRIDFWSENYFLYFEDVDICYKIKKLGLKIKLIPDTVIRHKVSTPSSGSLEKLTPFSSYYFARAGFVFIKKNLGLVKTFTATIGQLLFKLPVFTLAMVKEKNLSAWLAFIRGYRDGLKYLFS